jgi:hypothetical protein
MQVAGGSWRCPYCDKAVDIPVAASPTMITSQASGQPNHRVFVIEGDEVHRCEIRTDGPDGA